MVKQSNKRITAVVGLVATGILALYVCLRIQATSEVTQLVEALSSDNSADSAWAFQKLKALEDSKLWKLLPQIQNDARTTLRHMARSDDHFNGVIGAPQEPDVYSVSQVALFLLSTRLSDRVEVNHANPRNWARALEQQQLPSGTILDRAVDFLRWPKRVAPPSADLSRLRMSRSHDVKGLLAVLTGKDAADAAWAFEILTTLPDERVDALLQSATSRKHVPLDSLCWVWPTGSAAMTLPAGCTLGQVIRYLLCTRTRLYGTPRLIPHELWSQGVVKNQETEALIARWKAHVAGISSQ
jgi:hypothetical protein